jgi:hypothetical protein
MTQNPPKKTFAGRDRSFGDRLRSASADIRAVY